MRPVIDQQLYHPETEKVITYNLTNIPCESLQKFYYDGIKTGWFISEYSLNGIFRFL